MFENQNRCFQCGTKFVPYHDSDFYCSERCRKKHYSYLKKVPRCSECSGYECEFKHTYKGKTSPKECREREG